MAGYTKMVYLPTS